MRPKTIRITSTALGPRLGVTVLVYETVEEMRRAASAYSGGQFTNALGVTHARTDETGRAVSVLVRMVRGHLGTEIITHEMHHAVTALYGAHVGDRVKRGAHLNHYNEPFAYLYGNLTARLVNRLYAHGYYSADGT